MDHILQMPYIVIFIADDCFCTYVYNQRLVYLSITINETIILVIYCPFSSQFENARFLYSIIQKLTEGD